MPRISVIMPTYNRARFLGDAIRSVLAQTLTDFEVIVVDDGSTDNTSEIVRAFADPRVKYLRQDNQGPAGARNNGIRASTGEYVSFLDSDDTFLPRKLEIQARALDLEYDLGLVAGGYEFIDEGGRLLREERPWIGRPSLDLPTILLGGVAPVHAVMVRREWLDRVGSFDASFRAAEDMDLWYRLSLAGCRMDWVPATVCRYRIHRRNMSRSVRDHYRALNAVLETVFARSDLPEQIRGRRDEIYAQACLGEAGRLYGAGDIEDAKGALRSALLLDPGLRRDNDHRLADAMVAWERSVWAGDRAGLLDQVLENLPTEPLLPHSTTFNIRLQAQKASFYEAFAKGDAGQVRRLWLKVARQDLTWIRNRGSWSILVQSAGLLHPRRREA